MATIRDVASAAGVSTSTVSHVINGTRYVSPDTSKRVLEAMESLGYRHNRLASSLRSQKTFTFGVLLPNNANPYFADVLAGIEHGCYERGYNIIMGNANDDPERELSYLQVLLARQVDGVLLISTGAYDESRALLEASSVPFVMVDRPTERADVDAIFTANVDGGRLATEHLLGLGHRRIACITGPSILTPSSGRVDGYRAAMHDAGQDVVEEWVVSGDFQHEGGYNAMCKLLKLPAEKQPTAVFACNDLMAIGAMYALHEAGLRVPEDVSVMGYDDIPLASYVIPSLTTVAQPGREVGELAVKILISRLQQPQAPPHRDVLPVSLVERESCRAITQEEEEVV